MRESTRISPGHYADRAYAREEYATLPPTASAALSSDWSPCASACPNGIPIPEYTRQAARALS